MRLPLLKQSDGKKSVSFTMMIIGFSVITLWLVLSIFEKIGNWPIREFNSTDAMAFFSPLALLYFGRRWMQVSTGSKNGPLPSSSSDEVIENSAEEEKP